MSNTDLAQPEDLDLVNLDHVITNYNCETDRLLINELPQLEKQLWGYICDYDAHHNNAAMPLAAHMKKLSSDAAMFLATLGFEAKAAENLRRAALFSKLGYVHQANTHNGFAPGSPAGRNEYAAAREFARHGRAVLKATLDAFSPELQAHPHVRVVMPALMDFRHECKNGRGPHGREGTDMGLVIRVAAIADAYERQFRGVSSADLPETPIEAIERMCGADNPGLTHNMFDRKLLEAYARFQTEHTNRTSNARGIVGDMAVETA
jgi:HD-GYP domain-containing protein (c-di-GMP phosphodiesterase class II)